MLVWVVTYMHLWKFRDVVRSWHKWTPSTRRVTNSSVGNAAKLPNVKDLQNAKKSDEISECEIVEEKQKQVKQGRKIFVKLSFMLIAFIYIGSLITSSMISRFLSKMLWHWICLPLAFGWRMLTVNSVYCWIKYSVTAHSHEVNELSAILNLL